MPLFNIESKEIYNPEGDLLGTATMVVLRVRPDEADDSNIAPGYFEYRDASGQIHPEARGNMPLNVANWDADQNSVFANFLTVLDLTSTD